MNAVPKRQFYFWTGKDRFTLLGKDKVNIQWLLFCTVHNIGKCIAPLSANWRQRTPPAEKIRTGVLD
jgi:hypothetical protein